MLLAVLGLALAVGAARSSAATVSVTAKIAVDTSQAWMPPGSSLCFAVAFVEVVEIPNARNYLARVRDTSTGAIFEPFNQPNDNELGWDDQWEIFAGGQWWPFHAPPGTHRKYLAHGGWTDCGGMVAYYEGLYDIVSVTAEVEGEDPPDDNQPPMAAFQWSSSDDDPLTVEFDASGSSDDKGITRYEWDFGDGARASGQVRAHTYTEPGTYSVKLTVYDAEGLSGTTTRVVTVGARDLSVTGELVSRRGSYVLPGDRATLRVQARSRSTADEIVVEAYVPKGTNLVPGTISHAGERDGERTVRWRFSELATTPVLELEVQVDSVRYLPPDMRRIEARGTAAARYGTAEERRETTMGLDLARSVLVNSTGDDPDTSASDRVCDTGNTVSVQGTRVPECTLRAGIAQAVANARAGTASDLWLVTFDIPSAGAPVIRPATALPELSDGASVDGSTQPASPGLDPHVVVDGAKAPRGTPGLRIAGRQSIVRGLAITGFPGDGIFVDGMDNTVESSWIGTSPAGAEGGNAAAGIRIVGDSSGNTIRGIVASFNDGPGVAVGGGRRNEITQSAINRNGGPAIDLGDDGDDAIDDLDLDDGPNGRQNTAVLISSSDALVGKLRTAPRTPVRIEVFTPSCADPFPRGGSDLFVGSLTLRTDDSGNASFSLPTNRGPLSVTVTGPDGTSEFSEQTYPPEAAERTSARAAASGSACAMTELDWIAESRYDPERNIPLGHYTHKALGSQYDPADGVVASSYVNPGAYWAIVFVPNPGKGLEPPFRIPEGRWTTMPKPTCDGAATYSWRIEPLDGRATLREHRDRRIRVSPVVVDSSLNRGTATGKGMCAFWYGFPAEGKYRVSVGISRSGEVRNRSAVVTIQDWLVVGLGDSYGSGEGEPDAVGSYSLTNAFGKGVKLGAELAERCLVAKFYLELAPEYLQDCGRLKTVTELKQYATQPARWQFEQCHRSRFSYQALAAARLERGDRRTSVTFIHTACSGSRVRDLLNTEYAGVIAPRGVSSAPYRGTRSATGGRLLPQLAQVYQRTINGGNRTREVDAVLLSSGGNDIGFGGIVEGCVLAPPHVENFIRDFTSLLQVFAVQNCRNNLVTYDVDAGKLTHLDNDPSRKRSGTYLDQFFDTKFRSLRSRSYPALNGALRAMQISPNRVYITPYPSPTRDKAGYSCNGGFPLPYLPFGIMRAESVWVEGDVIWKLREAVRDTADNHGWKVVPTQSLSDRRGFCNANLADRDVYLVLESLRRQGDKFGAMHPTMNLLVREAALTYRMLRSDLYRNGGPRAPLTIAELEKGQIKPFASIVEKIGTLG